jgi:hypothetical protein
MVIERVHDREAEGRIEGLVQEVEGQANGQRDAEDEGERAEVGAVLPRKRLRLIEPGATARGAGAFARRARGVEAGALGTLVFLAMCGFRAGRRGEMSVYHMVTNRTTVPQAFARLRPDRHPSMERFVHSRKLDMCGVAGSAAARRETLHHNTP